MVKAEKSCGGSENPVNIMYHMYHVIAISSPKASQNVALTTGDVGGLAEDAAAQRARRQRMRSR